MESARNYDTHAVGNPSSPQSTGNSSMQQMPKLYDNITDEEKVLLRQCRSKGFWYMCVPITAGLSLTTAYGLKSGFLKPTRRFGPRPYYFGAIFAGYLMGRMLYYPTCIRNIVEACPDGSIARQMESLKQRSTPGDQRYTRHQQEHGAVSDSPGDHDPSIAQALPDGTDAPTSQRQQKEFSYADARNRNRAQESRLPLWNRPLDSRAPVNWPLDNRAPDNQPTVSHGTTTEQPQPILVNDEPRYPTQEASGQTPSPADERQPGRARKNEYGDEWEE